ncbi:MAG: dephospho-CoA kinase [Syntrophomonas sp.]
MKVIGLTGGIASGKSVVSRALQTLGAVIINADEIAHNVVGPEKPAWKEIIRHFGHEILNEDRSINRKKLGGIVFDDPEKLAQLNQITHPYIIKEIRDSIKNAGQANPKAVILVEVPLLFETHMDKLFDEIWVIWVDRETQIRRLMERDGIGEEDAIKRIETQMPLDEKAKRADLVIDNRHDIQETIVNITRYFNNILQHS